MRLIYDDYNWNIRGGCVIGTVSRTWFNEAFTKFCEGRNILEHLEYWRSMNCKAIIGWVRDSHGAVLHRTFKGDVCNAIRTTAGAGWTSPIEVLNTTTPYVMEVWYVCD